MARILVPALALLPACGSPAIGRGGAIYEVVVYSVNDRLTATRGAVGFPACTIQVGNRTARVWLARDPPRSEPSPPLFLADAAALKDGVLVEATWDAAVVHEVSEEELAVGAAVVHVPFRSPGHNPGVGYHTVELRFRRVASPAIAAK
jgi:hypothetical protein